MLCCWSLCLLETPVWRWIHVIQVSLTCCYSHCSRNERWNLPVSMSMYRHWLRSPSVQVCHSVCTSVPVCFVFEKERWRMCVYERFCTLTVESSGNWMSCVSVTVHYVFTPALCVCDVCVWEREYHTNLELNMRSKYDHIVHIKWCLTCAALLPPVKKVRPRTPPPPPPVPLKEPSPLSASTTSCSTLQVDQYSPSPRTHSGEKVFWGKKNTT